MTLQRNPIYDSNLHYLADAVLRGQHCNRSDQIAERMRTSLLTMTENPIMPFSADYALKWDYDRTFVSNLNQRSNPLNNALPKAVWDYDLKEEQLEISLAKANPESMAIKVDESLQDFQLKAKFESYTSLILPNSSKLDQENCTKNSAMNTKNPRKCNFVRLQDCEMQVHSRRDLMIRNFSEGVWNTFVSANRTRHDCLHSNKQRLSSVVAVTNNQMNMGPSALPNALKSVSLGDRIFLASLFENGSTNMDLNSEDAKKYATALLILIDSENCKSSPFHFTYSLNSDSPHLRHDLLAIFDNPAVKIAFNFKLVFRNLASVVSLPSLLSSLNGALFDLKIGAFLLYTDIATTSLTFDSISFRMNSNERTTLENPKFVLEQFSKYVQELFCEMSSQYISMLQIQERENMKLADIVNFESQVALVLALMESDGVKIDQECLRIQLSRVKDKLKELEQKCYEHAGHSFNLASPDQVARVLFDELGLKDLTKLESGHRSTSEHVLASLKAFHALPGIILPHRTLSKLVGTYIEPLLSASKGTHGIIHTNWNQCSCATGRISSSGPNLQSLPKCKSRSSPSDESEIYIAGIRKAFVCDPDEILVAADYKQMEIRVFAMLSQDKNLNSAIARSVDLYQNLGSIIFNKPSSSIDALEKSQAKTIFLAIIYGMGPKSLSKKLSCLTKNEFSYADALAFNLKVASQFPQMQNYVSATISFCRKHGFVETITGRRRHLPDIKSTDERKRRQAERQAVNSVIQGSASDIMKCAMLKLVSLLEKHALSISAKIRLQIHDELVVSCPKNTLELVSKLLVDAMQENQLSLQCKGQLQVSLEIGTNLRDLKPTDYENICKMIST